MFGMATSLWFHNATIMVSCQVLFFSLFCVPNGPADQPWTRKLVCSLQRTSVASACSRTHVLSREYVAVYPQVRTWGAQRPTYVRVHRHAERVRCKRLFCVSFVILLSKVSVIVVYRQFFFNKFRYYLYGFFRVLSYPK